MREKAADCTDCTHPIDRGARTARSYLSRPPPHSSSHLAHAAAFAFAFSFHDRVRSDARPSLLTLASGSKMKSK